jgi:diadenosine tetraphosphate (Ap4A) HIT family hydrolase
MLPLPFASPETLRLAFVSGLSQLLNQPGLGVYILAHANASFDGAIFEQLKAPLRQCFEQLALTCRESLRNGRELVGASDDQAVFLKLLAIGFDGVKLTEFRREEEWELQFNHIRAFRPPRMAETTVKGIHQPFDPDGFHFNKPFLRKEVFWAGELQGLEVELLYNKFPFAPMHGLLVPERRSREAQFLSHPYHLYVWALTQAMAERLPEVGFAYNSYGAYASVNHLHFQMFVRSEPLPLTLGHWRHNGGNVDYPTTCEVYTSAGAAWERLETLHAAEISYNLLYLPGRLYCLPRKTQGSYSHSSWTSGFAWYEAAGGITTFNRTDYATLDAATLRAEIGKLNI